MEPGGALEMMPEERRAVHAVLAGPNIFKRPYKLFLLLRLNALYEGDGAVIVAPEATVEHIGPQKPGPQSRWAIDYGKSPDMGRLLHSLGNLTLLTEAEQNAAANGEFEVKQAIYRRSGFALTRRVADRARWQPEDIAARTGELVGDFFKALGIG